MRAEQSVNDTICATLLNLPGIIIVQGDIEEQENCGSLVICVIL